MELMLESQQEQHWAQDLDYEIEFEQQEGLPGVFQYTGGCRAFDEYNVGLSIVDEPEVDKSDLGGSWVWFFLSRINARTMSLSSATSDETAWVEELVLILATTALFLD
ncbi:hypothetical protein Tco_0878514 [Tanacetum coccineum]|uniref:Uncharacterized protein n=1 Tax=Tanacetum coccineum TaxID=301880 RepID=A0ABQ5BZQ8_9ASTR